MFSKREKIAEHVRRKCTMSQITDNDSDSALAEDARKRLALVDYGRSRFSLVRKTTNGYSGHMERSKQSILST
jgi:hypothetical protein